VSVTFLFGVHMHQPVDNFDEAVNRAVVDCYEPFFEVMSNYPEFKFSLHCSGWLLQKIKSDYPSLYKNIQKLNNQGSIEFVGAGFYEPILSVIPSRDRRGQIDMLLDYIENEFGSKPTGLWLTERVWESSIVPDVVDSGIEYMVVDDYHFIASGFEPDNLSKYYMTEEGGKRVALFPISKALRYAIPFRPVKEAIEAIKSQNSSAVLFDDLEKFGMWPNTHEWVYGKGWLREFVESVLADGDIVTSFYSQYIKENTPNGLAYLSNVSYYEMGEWSLRERDSLKLRDIKKIVEDRFGDIDSQKFVKGGIWKNFLIKYQEANHIHKRVLSCSNRSNGTQEYIQALYKAQTNDVLWHGVFGGLYLPNLRDNAYRYIIECEDLIYKENILLEDFNIDGYLEAKSIKGESLMIFASKLGGALIEWDSLIDRWNYQNTLTRYKEAYHSDILNSTKSTTKIEDQNGIDTIHTATIDSSKDLKDSLVYDNYQKVSFIDHITDSSISAYSLYKNSFKEYANFINLASKMSIDSKCITSISNGTISNRYPATVTKSFYPTKRGVKFAITLDTKAVDEYYYGVEFNFHFANIADITIDNEPFDRLKDIEATTNISIYDSFTNKTIKLNLSKSCRCAISIVETISMSEDGFDKMVQGISMIVYLPFNHRVTLSGSLEFVDV